MVAAPQAPATVAPRLPLLQVLLGIGAIVCVVALLALPSFAPWLSRLDYWTADWRTAYLSRNGPTAHPRVTVVTINDDTLKDYASSPIDRGLLARIVKAIDAAGAAAIGIDVFFLKATEPDKDAALVAAVRNARAPVVLGAIDERGALQGFQRQFQAAFLAEMQRPAGYLNLRHERDSVVRYTASPAPGSAFPKSFARLLAEAVGAPTADDAGKPIAWLLQAADGAEAYLRIPAQDLLAASAGAAPAGAPLPDLKGRIVLLGGDFPLRDRHRVPLSVRDGEPVPGVLIHANVVAGLLEPGRAIRELTPATVRILLGVVAAAGFLLGWALWQSGAVRLVGWSFASAVLVAIDAFCFVKMQTLLPFTLALVAWVAGLTAGRALHILGDHLIFSRGSKA
ncbi:MAG: CHASE2 domain-containing protein [Hyphomicrobiaceae bacterium]